ncbi:hypothetical protein SAMN04487970_10624 [Paenibacillus tianmuensis]|uniref:Uncharacterized protein n=1 Tax=Paenibacillus tianmuensis TaxID=624147 RepID=A0A1G4TQL5_9BACL|nr:hypothetical protein [Paenibacillus tianmuensis]SCW83631.1 hypothetical protein SAMN04487970_10624 [Paenibacillus tianmuensis]
MRRFSTLLLTGILFSSSILPVAASTVDSKDSNQIIDALSDTTLDSALSASLEAYFDEDISEADKQKLKLVMSKLDEKHRQDVIHINRDGSVISNKSDNVKKFKEGNKEKLDATGKLNMSASDWGIRDINTIKPVNIESLSTGWKHPDDESENVNTGPYRRALSNVGYSRLVADVWLPKKGDGLYISNNGNEKAWAYTGAIDKDGDSIDIGLAYNYESGPNAWDETWGMAIKGANNVTLPAEKNFQGGQYITLDFYVWANNAVALFAAGYNRQGYYVGSTLTAELPWRYDFYANGEGMKVKRITSIAQLNQDLNSGSVFKYAHWSNVKIGQRYNPSISQDWGKFYGYPRNRILVDYTSQSDEKVWIQTAPF